MFKDFLLSDEWKKSPYWMKTPQCLDVDFAARVIMSRHNEISGIAYDLFYASLQYIWAHPNDKELPKTLFEESEIRDDPVSMYVLKHPDEDLGRFRTKEEKANVVLFKRK